MLLSKFNVTLRITCYNRYRKAIKPLLGFINKRTAQRATKGNSMTTLTNLLTNLCHFTFGHTTLMLTRLVRVGTVTGTTRL